MCFKIIYQYVLKVDFTKYTPNCNYHYNLLNLQAVFRVLILPFLVYKEFLRLCRDICFTNKENIHIPF